MILVRCADGAYAGSTSTIHATHRQVQQPISVEVSPVKRRGHLWFFTCTLVHLTLTAATAVACHAITRKKL